MNSATMTIPNPDHLFDQAQQLVAKRTGGAIRQVDIRRAISASYYGVFHAVSAACADQIVGVTQRHSANYALVYRSIDHKWLRDFCEDLKKSSPPARYRSYLPPAGLGPDITSLALSLVELQERRHTADYDPSISFKTSDALAAVRTAIAATTNLRAAPVPAKQIFIILLLFPPRR